MQEETKYEPELVEGENGRLVMPINKEKWAELRNYKLMLGIPMYGGSCLMQCMTSILRLQQECTKFGIELSYHFLAKESLVTRARNQIAAAFRQSDSTHLLFIDADIEFNPMDVLAMLYIQHMRQDDIKIICGPYPKKHISWEKVKEAVDKGLGDENPNNLAAYVPEFVFNLSPSQGNQINLRKLLEVSESGTGFMMIERSVFDDFEKAYPEQKYLPDHVRAKETDGSVEFVAFFDTVICPESRRYLSEDYMFCQWVRKLGHKIWLMPWAVTTHIGIYEYHGDMLQVMAAGIHPLVDMNKMVQV